MSVRNIEQGYYELPSNETVIPISFTGAASITIPCSFIVNHGSIMINIPYTLFIAAATDSLRATIPTQFTLPSSSQLVQFNSSKLNIQLSVSTRQINIFADSIMSTFTSGTTYTIMATVLIYNLVLIYIDMSVRNILDGTGGVSPPTVDFHFDHTATVTFTGPGTETVTVVFRRSNSLCVIAIDPIYLDPITTPGILFSTGFTLPPEMTPIGPTAYTNVYVNNGTNKLGVGYLTKGGGIGISGGPKYDDPFTVGPANAGIPFGCLLVYSIV